MSRIGKQPVSIPNGVTVTLQDGVLTVKGPKGELTQAINPLVSIEITDTEVLVVREGNEREKRAMHGLFRSLIQNMVTGVSEGFKRRLEINGVGYRAQMQGTTLVLSLGFSHPVNYPAPEGITLSMDAEKKNVIVVEGVDKQKVGQVASEIRGFRPPEPYKGKGVKYEEEHIRRKAGKTASKG